MSKDNKTMLGRDVTYASAYSPKILHPIARQHNRQKRGIHNALPFNWGFDIWNAYEISWLDNRGKPCVAMARFIVASDSEFIVESKSLKIYLNSLNDHAFSSWDSVRQTLTHDLTQAFNGCVSVELYAIDVLSHTSMPLPGSLIDDRDASITEYEVNPGYLIAMSDEFVHESVYSHLFKSNCPVTQQPDWATVHISYRGCPISHDGLLKYLVSYRHMNEFHEDCVEHIFGDIMQYCRPESLTVAAYFTRRGGLDINPIRSTEILDELSLIRFNRQ